MSDTTRPEQVFSDPLSRYSGGGLGWGLADGTHRAEPPPQPSPGVPGEGETRRTFLSSAVRSCVAVGLTGLCIHLVVQQPAKADCVKIVPCDDCNKFDGCDLPKAKLARANKDENATGAADAG